ncbi:MAG: hypothetical protein KKC80_08880 [Candidatus Margulisbacteria bacterium]|nr:hypothetical protein [Candidatus Margulisiibacteriota bacterium]
MADATYKPKVYRKQGGDEFVVANGGRITIEPGGEITGGFLPQGYVYHVDGEDGSDSNDGLTWATAVQTIAAARTLAHANIDWSDGETMQYVLVRCGVYAEELGGIYYTTYIGQGIRGTDSAAEIHPTENSCIAGTLLSAGFINMRFEVDEASTPIIDGGIVNNSFFLDCEFALGANVAGVAAIDTENCTHLEVSNCEFTSGQLQNMAYNIYHRGGADKYAHNVRIKNCRMFAATANVYVDSLCTATQMVIGPDNFMAGAAKGVDDNNGNSYVFGNFITATDAIEHANSATQCVGNYVINNGTGAVETTHV